MKTEKDKTYDTMLTSIPTLQALDSVVHKFKVEPQHGRQMFSICVKNSIKPEILQQVQFIQNSDFLKQEQSNNYIEFAKKRLYSKKGLKE